MDIESLSQKSATALINRNLKDAEENILTKLVITISLLLHKFADWLIEKTKKSGIQEANKNISDELTRMIKSEEEIYQDYLAHLRENCGWFQWYRVCLIFSNLIQGIPFHLKWDYQTRRHVIVTSNWRKAMWLAFHTSSAVIFWTDCIKTVADIRASHDTMMYFELMVILGYFGFDYPFKYKWFFKIPNVCDFFDELQASPLLLQTASPKRLWRYLLHTSFYISYFYTIFTFFLLHWEVHYWDWGVYYETLQTAMETYYWIPKSCENCWWYKIALFIAFFFITQHTGYSHCCDLIGLTGIVLMNRVSHDVDRAIKSGKFTDDEVYEILQAHKRVTKKFNRAFGLLVCVYVTYCSPYLSLHCVDMFDIPGFMNRYNICMYFVCLFFACKLSIDCIVLAKRRKKWMITNGRFLKLERRRLAFFLDDITWEKYGLGSFFEVNSFVSGEIASLLLTVAVIKIQM